MRVFLLSFLAVALLSGIPANAQFFKVGPDKTAKLDIPHTPAFGLTVKRVAFGQPEGTCRDVAQELIDRIILPAFQQNQVDVVERQALNQIMAEHNFQQSGNVDAASAVALGRILGPSALIIVSVNDCSSEKQPLFNDQRNFLNNAVTRTYISKTRYSLEGSIRVVDLTTGQVKGSHNFEGKPDKQNTATNGQPEFPPVDDVKDMALQSVGQEIHNMFFVWLEPVQLAFYDDKDCGLKQVYETYKNGDFADALRLADGDVEQCKSNEKKEKVLLRAYYDDGLLNCVQKNYAKADQLFTNAMQGKGAEAVARASSECKQAQSGVQQLKDYEQREAQVPAPQPISVAAIAPPAATNGFAQAAPPSAAIAPTASNKPATAPVEQRLKQLSELYKKGLISKREYDQRRAAILATL
ncbi:MAG: SHOCT domain-containing protein [Edaphobacter sp.]